MATSSRTRFVLTACIGYALLSLAWILLSDRVLMVLVDKDSMARFSSLKGAFFILVTTVLLYFTLRAVPANEHDKGASVLARYVDALGPERRRHWLYYLFAVVITLLALAIRQSLVPVLGGHPMLTLFMLPIMLSALVGGLWPGLLATAVAALGVAYFAVAPLGSFWMISPKDVFVWSLMIFNGMVLSALSELLLRALRVARAERSLLESVVAGNTDAVFVKDRKGRYLLANQAVASLIDKPLAEIIGRDDRALFPAESARLIAEKDRAVLEQDRVSMHSEHLKIADGRELDFLVTKGPVHDANGEVAGLFGIARDVTARKKMEVALRSSELALKAAQRLSGLGSWEWDLRHDVHLWSEEVYVIYGRDPALPPVACSAMREYFTPASWAELSALVDTALATGTGYTHDAEIVRGDGRHGWITIRARVERDGDGQVVKLAGTVQDITERKLTALRLQLSEARMQMAIEATSDGLWDWDVAGRAMYCSPQFHQRCGFRPEPGEDGMDFFQRIIAPDDMVAARLKFRLHERNESSVLEFDFRLAGERDSPRWIRLKGRAVQRDGHGRPVRLVGTLSEITEYKKTELALREASTVFENSYEGIMVVKPDMTISKVNPAFSRITGFSADEVVGRTPKTLASGIHGADFYRQMWESVKHYDFWCGEIWNRRRNGEVYAEMLSISVVRDGNGVIQYYIGVFSDISQLKAHEAELDRIAHYDPLTGTPNRRLLTDRLGQAITHALRKGKSLAVCFVDLDGFKLVNDTYGHSAGDRLLIGVTDNLKQVLRADDTLARLGGDEFVLLLSDLESAEECVQILERVLDAINRPIVIEGRDVAISASIGVSLFPDDNADADTLLRHADQTMYRAKEAGKNRFQLFDPESDRKAQHHRHYLDEIRLGLKRDEFVLYYQPKVDMVNGEVIGAEALVRWLHPERGLIAPGEFLPYVENSELEVAFGQWVMKTAVAQAVAWYRSGLELRVSANISARHLLQPEFHQQVRQVLDLYPEWPASLLELEILETAAIADLEAANDILQRCHALGVQFALDDFGTGYSSLTYLRKLPFDMLKIDQSFVRNMLTDADDMGIVDGVIRLARAFTREVIAEGVETLVHGAVLRKMGCRLAQGYGVGRPMPAAAFPDWCREWSRGGAWLHLDEYSPETPPAS